MIIIAFIMLYLHTNTENHTKFLNLWYYNNIFAMLVHAASKTIHKLKNSKLSKASSSSVAHNQKNNQSKKL